MRSSPPRIVSFSNNRGVPGSIVRTTLVGTGLETVTEVHISGFGIQAQILRPACADTIGVTIYIATYAAPGPRAVRLFTTAQGLIETGAMFYVLAASSYASATGIGSHLI